MRLTDELAARRHIYTHPSPGTPTLVAIDIPSRLAGDGLALERYYIVVAETPEELTEFETVLASERPHLVAPDLLDYRPSNTSARAITFIEYAPDEPEWPWILLCIWPTALTRPFKDDPDLLARGVYTFEAFATRGQMVGMALETMAKLDGVEVHLMLRAAPPE